MVADLHQHRDRFGVSRAILGRVVGAGPKLPAIAIANNGDDHAVRRIGMNPELRPRHLDQFGFGLGELAHALPPTSFVRGCPFACEMSRTTRSWTRWRAGTRAGPRTRIIF